MTRAWRTHVHARCASWKTRWSRTAHDASSTIWNGGDASDGRTTTTSRRKSTAKLTLLHPTHSSVGRHQPLVSGAVDTRKPAVKWAMVSPLAASTHWRISRGLRTAMQRFLCQKKLPVWSSICGMETRIDIKVLLVLCVGVGGGGGGGGGVEGGVCVCACACTIVHVRDSLCSHHLSFYSAHFTVCNVQNIYTYFLLFPLHFNMIVETVYNYVYIFMSKTTSQVPRLMVHAVNCVERHNFLRPLHASQAYLGCQRPSYTSTAHRRPMQAVAGHRRPSQAVTGWCRPLQAIPGRYRPSQAIMTTSSSRKF